MVPFFESAAVDLAGVDADAPVSSPLAPAFAGAVRNIPEAHANACNTASRTSLLLEFMISPWLFFVAFLSQPVTTTLKGRETPTRFVSSRSRRGARSQSGTVSRYVVESLKAFSALEEARSKRNSFSR
jgi:hypothetical protein